MAEILVTEADGRYDVTLTDGASTSRHEVRVSAADLAQLGLDGCDPRLVVEESMRFLLEREPKESILATFDLETIRGFFPIYADEIRRRMAGERD
jgi:hypothetical protein